MDQINEYFYDGISIQNHRDSNMDSLLLKKRVINSNSVYMAVVCDGVGSLENGAFAAFTAVEKLNEWFDTVEETKRLGLQLLDRVQEISGSISFLAKSKKLQTASTLSALLIVGERYYIVHTGDSRIYGCKQEQVVQLTTDQVSGQKLTACLGREGKTQLIYDEGQNDMQTYLLCSDGLYKKMDPAYLKDMLLSIRRKNLKRTMEKLIQYVVERNETDNISLAIITCKR